MPDMMFLQWTDDTNTTLHVHINAVSLQWTGVLHSCGVTLQCLPSHSEHFISCTVQRKG